MTDGRERSCKTVKPLKSGTSAAANATPKSAPATKRELNKTTPEASWDQTGEIAAPAYELENLLWDSLKQLSVEFK